MSHEIVPEFKVTADNLQARVREEDARAAAGEPTRTPDEKQEYLDFLQRVNEFTATLPDDLTPEELVEFMMNSGLEPPDSFFT